MTTNNGYKLAKITVQERQSPPSIEDHNNKKWTTFAHFDPQIRTLTEIFKPTNLYIAYSMDNSIKHKTLYKQQDNDKYSRSGIYKLKYEECNKVVYIGQTGRSFTARYAEHISDIKHNRDKSKYVKYLLHHQHAYGRK
jgi:hypothetical protein